MNKDNLILAIKLNNSIDSLKNEITRWEKSTCFGSSIRGYGDTYSGYDDLPTKHIPFGVVKTLVLDAMNKELIDLTKQFEAL